MAKTLDVARDREYDQQTTVLPVEVARGIYIQNPPSAQALKIMHFMIAAAGPRMADDVAHEFRLSALRRTDRMRNHDRASLTPLFEELRGAVLTCDNTETQQVVIGGLLDEATVDYREEANGDLVISWWFARTFRRMAEESNHWALIDRQTVFNLSSKYSILLFQHIASLVRQKHTASVIFPVDHLRLVLGVGRDKLTNFGHLNARAIQPAIDEINRVSRYTLEAQPIRKGRGFGAVSITWKAKDEDLMPEDPAAPPAQRSLNLVAYAGFPEGSIFNTRWQALFDKHKPKGVVIAGIADQFRASCRAKDIPLDAPDIETTFVQWLERL